jgi:hypothetical protein
MTERMSDGEIAHVVGGLIEGEKNADGARRLLEEIGRRLRHGERLEGTHLADYLGWAIKRLQSHEDANRAFGLTRPEGPPNKNAERDELLAFLVQRRLSSGKYDSEDAAALAVRDKLLELDPPVELSHDGIRNIYRRLKDDPIVRAAATWPY